MTAAISPLEQQRQESLRAARARVPQMSGDNAFEGNEMAPADQLAQRYAHGPMLETGGSVGGGTLAGGALESVQTPANSQPVVPPVQGQLGQSQQTATTIPQNQSAPSVQMERERHQRLNQARRGPVNEDQTQKIAGATGKQIGRNAGATVGASVGGSIGSAIPGAGTAAGAAVGKKIGGEIGGKIGESTAKETVAALMGSGGAQIDSLKKILMLLLLMLASLIDIINLFALGTVIDWIADILFFVAVFIVTFDGLGSAFMKRQMTNFIGMVAEFIPVIDILPFHILVVVLIYMDMKTGLISKAMSVKSLSPASK